jgi:hypothetical protein
MKVDFSVSRVHDKQNCMIDIGAQLKSLKGLKS